MCGQPRCGRGFIASCWSGCLGFAVWAATRGFIASCRSGCLGFAVWAATRGFFASCRSGCPGSRGAVWAATRGFIASCRSACLSPSSCMSTWLGRAALNLHGCNCVGTLCICVGHACVVGWWGGLRCRAEQPQSTQARGFNAALVRRFPALYGYMPEALSAPHWYRARGRRANGPPPPAWRQATLRMCCSHVCLLEYGAQAGLKCDSRSDRPVLVGLCLSIEQLVARLSWLSHGRHVVLASAWI